MIRILAPDDPDLIHALQESVLRREGCEIHTAASGEDALEKASSVRPDLCVLDPGMAGIGGLDCCRRLRRAEGLSDVAVLFLGQVLDYPRCRDAGGDAFVARPLSRERLMTVIRQLVPLRERSCPRRPVSIEVTLRGDAGTGSGAMRNVGVEGLFLDTDYRVSPGESVALTFRIPRSPETLIESRGRVVRAVPLDARAGRIVGIGVQFQRLSARDRMEIGRYVAEHTGEQP